MIFEEYNYNEDLNFRLKSIKKIKFKKTYYKINYYYLEGIVDTKEDLSALEYLMTRNINYNAGAISTIIDLTKVNYNTLNFSLLKDEDYVFVVNDNKLQHENFFSTSLEAVNFLVKSNIKVFPNSKYTKYDTLPEMEDILLDKEASNVSVKLMLSNDGNVGYLKLEGVYPYKGYLEANYISNMLDILIEFKSINKLIIDVKDFELERDWDNELPDLEPTHIRYYKTKEVEVFYLATKEKIFMNEHDNLFFSLDEIINSSTP
ncbi:hypothetical protein ACE1MK_13310 [Tenacibaculum maritimum]|uniref:hypothetical protein n=1 Tax=Tenacibaculum maritimum TaxID=107401 RepID=UPI0012E57F2E|nr:hypothetical protein [Tenacibaculum maritimum]MCD9583373.1 hypothetical protein [Tenacibaculum maritimum]MCD9637333.1 hypothetical protein [Tenacibaculum maritimum]CAA0156693.1 conserved hypothetical protein [Tenacibaculum maritimum]CAA0186363.1 conserved hypothetical protein [Tenacibaculum maritimum]CAA0228829.1 conserved hypothetical protein [Tenacibaculum maritimum]